MATTTSRLCKRDCEPGSSSASDQELSAFSFGAILKLREQVFSGMNGATGTTSSSNDASSSSPQLGNYQSLDRDSGTADLQFGGAGSTTSPDLSACNDGSGNGGGSGGGGGGGGLGASRRNGAGRRCNSERRTSADRKDAVAKVNGSGSGTRSRHHRGDHRKEGRRADSNSDRIEGNDHRNGDRGSQQLARHSLVSHPLLWSAGVSSGHDSTPCSTLDSNDYMAATAGHSANGPMYIAESHLHHQPLPTLPPMNHCSRGGPVPVYYPAQMPPPTESPPQATVVFSKSSRLTTNAPSNDLTSATAELLHDQVEEDSTAYQSAPLEGDERFWYEQQITELQSVIVELRRKMSTNANTGPPPANPALAARYHSQLRPVHEPAGNAELSAGSDHSTSDCSDRSGPVDGEGLAGVIGQPAGEPVVEWLPVRTAVQIHSIDEVDEDDLSERGDNNAAVGRTVDERHTGGHRGRDGVNRGRSPTGRAVHQLFVPANSIDVVARCSDRCQPNEKQPVNGPLCQSFDDKDDVPSLSIPPPPPVEMATAGTGVGVAGGTPTLPPSRSSVVSDVSAVRLTSQSILNQQQQQQQHDESVSENKSRHLHKDASELQPLVRQQQSEINRLKAKLFRVSNDRDHLRRQLLKSGQALSRTARLTPVETVAAGSAADGAGLAGCSSSGSAVVGAALSSGLFNAATASRRADIRRTATSDEERPSPCPVATSTGADGDSNFAGTDGHQLPLESLGLGAKLSRMAGLNNAQLVEHLVRPYLTGGAGSTTDHLDAGSSSAGPAWDQLSCLLKNPSVEPIVLAALEIERLYARVEHMKSQNDLLLATLEENKATCDRLSVSVAQLEANETSMRLAEQYADQIVEAYEALFQLSDANYQMLAAQCKAACLLPNSVPATAALLAPSDDSGFEFRPESVNSAGTGSSLGSGNSNQCRWVQLHVAATTVNTSLTMCTTPQLDSPPLVSGLTGAGASPVSATSPAGPSTSNGLAANGGASNGAVRDLTALLQRVDTQRKLAETRARHILQRLERKVGPWAAQERHSHLSSGQTGSNSGDTSLPSADAAGSGPCVLVEHVVDTNSRHSTASSNTSVSSTSAVDAELSRVDEQRLRDYIGQLASERQAVRVTVVNNLEPVITATDGQNGDCVYPADSEALLASPLDASTHLSMTSNSTRSSAAAGRLRNTSDVATSAGPEQRLTSTEMKSQTASVAAAAAAGSSDETETETLKHNVDLEHAVLLQELMAMKEAKAELKAKCYLLEKEKTLLKLQLNDQDLKAQALDAQNKHLKEAVSELDRAQRPAATSPRSPVKNVAEADLEEAAVRERKLRERVGELVATLEKLSRNSETRHQQSTEFCDDLKRANTALVGAFEKAKRRYQGKIRKLDSQLKSTVERYETKLKLLQQRIQLLEERTRTTSSSATSNSSHQPAALPAQHQHHLVRALHGSPVSRRLHPAPSASTSSAAASSAPSAPTGRLRSGLPKNETAL